jgi:hypothetical protein
MSDYSPKPRIRGLLDWCLNRVEQAPYRVTLRWLFYRAMQEKGLAKSDYKSFKTFTAVARKRFYEGWRPNTLADDTRHILEDGYGFTSYSDWLKAVSEQETCTLSKFENQEKIVQIWFEAEAMKSQFEYVTRDYHLTLVPFRGEASLDHKYNVAKALKQLRQEYRKPIVVLYFGDYDPKGLSIPESARRDIAEWLQISTNAP